MARSGRSATRPPLDEGFGASWERDGFAASFDAPAATDDGFGDFAADAGGAGARRAGGAAC